MAVTQNAPQLSFAIRTRALADRGVKGVASMVGAGSEAVQSDFGKWISATELNF